MVESDSLVKSRLACADLRLAQRALIGAAPEQLRECQARLEGLAELMTSLARSGEAASPQLRGPLGDLRRMLRQTARLAAAGDQWAEHRLATLAEPGGGAYTPTGASWETNGRSTVSVRG